MPEKRGHKNPKRTLVRRALDVRHEAGVPAWQPLCVFDFSEMLGVEVRFVDIASLEGMYWHSPKPKILLSSHRPPGRQAFTCGHELAHHILGHRTVVHIINVPEELPIDRRQEADADLLAGFLLMPKTAVERGFTARQWDARKPTPLQVYVVANWLGVGYTTLVNHMVLSLGLIGLDYAKNLVHTAPKSIIGDLVQGVATSRVVAVDEAWTDHPVDLQVGDVVRTPLGFDTTGPVLIESYRNQRFTFWRATCPGIGRLTHRGSTWASFVRCSRERYVGRNCFRHLAEV